MSTLTLVSINITAKGNVDARDLHRFLEVGTRWDIWLQRRIDDFLFNQDIDFTVIRNDRNEIKEFWLTLDMAKELCMLERSEKGREARKYFIECEKILREHIPAKVLTPLEMLAQNVAVAIEHDKKISHLQLVQTEIKENLGDVSFTPQQSSELKSLMEDRLRSFGLPMCGLGIFQNHIKDKWLPPKAHMTDYNWKLVSQKYYQEVHDFILSWVPTPRERETMRYLDLNKKGKRK